MGWRLIKVTLVIVNKLNRLLSKTLGKTTFNVGFDHMVAHITIRICFIVITAIKRLIILTSGAPRDFLGGLHYGKGTVA
jgi:hypothetical protein